MAAYRSSRADLVSALSRPQYRCTLHTLKALHAFCLCMERYDTCTKPSLTLQIFRDERASSFNNQHQISQCSLHLTLIQRDAASLNCVSTTLYFALCLMLGLMVSGLKWERRNLSRSWSNITRPKQEKDASNCRVFLTILYLESQSCYLIIRYFIARAGKI